MATKFMDAGTDQTQGLEFFTLVPGAPTSDTAQSKTGPRSIKCNTGAGASASRVVKNGVLQDSGSRISFYIRFTDLPGVTTLLCAKAVTGWGLAITSGGVLRLLNSGLIQV